MIYHYLHQSQIDAIAEHIRKDNPEKSFTDNHMFCAKHVDYIGHVENAYGYPSLGATREERDKIAYKRIKEFKADERISWVLARWDRQAGQDTYYIVFTICA